MKIQILSKKVLVSGIILLCIYLILLLFICLNVIQIISENTSDVVLPPVIQTDTTFDITNTSATLQATIIDDGSDNCSIWVEWDTQDLEAGCAGLIATGSVVKDGRSIFWKNRHWADSNQKPRYYIGKNYSYWGISTDSGATKCRFGLNEKGLMCGNFDLSGSINPTKRLFMSDNATKTWFPYGDGGDNGDHMYILGNFSTVAEAAKHLAQHMSHSSQMGIISAEKGVGAIITRDTYGWTNITWVNNSWKALGNAFVCNGENNTKNMLRIEEIITDIISYSNSSENDHLLNIRDIAQRLARDIDSGIGLFSEPNGYTGNYTPHSISTTTSASAFIGVGGDSSFDGAANMAWLNVGHTTHLGIFLPLGCSYLTSQNDIPANFTESAYNQNKGLEYFTDITEAYVQNNSGSTYQRDRVHRLHNYTFLAENKTFADYDALMANLTTLADINEVKARVKTFAETSMQQALAEYVSNGSNKPSKKTNIYYPQRNGIFSITLSGLSPGVLYYYKAWANNSLYTVNGSQKKFLTKPDKPTDAQAIAYNATQINLAWNWGAGAQYTIIERNTYPIWSMGSGIEIYNGSDNDFIDKELITGTHYYYQLWSYAFNNGCSQYSMSPAICNAIPYEIN